MSRTVPELPVVILHWRDPRAALRAAASVARSRDARPRVLVVENGSGDGSAEVLRQDLDPAAELLELPENLGYAGGMNAGIRWWEGRSEAPFVLLVTQDMEVDEGALAHLVGAAEDRLEAGALGPVVHFRDRPDRIFSAGGWLEPRRLRFGHHRALPDGDRGPVPVAWLDGCCLLLRRAALEDTGLLDEAYFMYMEEVDLCRRMADRGWEVVVVPRARARQDRPLLPGAHTPYYMARNQYRFWKTHAGASALRVAGRHAVATGGLLLWALRGRERGEDPGAAARVPPRLRLRRVLHQFVGVARGTLDHLRGRWGGRVDGSPGPG